VVPTMLIVGSLDGSLDACVNSGNVNVLICQHKSVIISVKSGSFLSVFVISLLCNCIYS